MGALSRRGLLALALAFAACDAPNPTTDCSPNCAGDPVCGNATVDGDEACDDGNHLDGDGCNADCTSDESCGNSILDAGESCDDGNRIGGDGCSNNCRVSESCGNGVRDANEDCDSMGQFAQGCDPDCTFSRCGDLMLNAAHAEECDDGNNVNGDGCDVGCHLEMCGNAHVEGNETCDDANGEDGDDCAACHRAYCGDGIRWALDNGNEQCDDGNSSDNDGCLSTCKRNRCGDGIQNPFAEECDDGNFTNDDECAECHLSYCGDGYQWINVEMCDDGNLDNGDSCEADCTEPFCGNGIIDDVYLGEQCDNGPANGTDGICDSSCFLI